MIILVGLLKLLLTAMPLPVLHNINHIIDYHNQLHMCCYSRINHTVNHKIHRNEKQPNKMKKELQVMNIKSCLSFYFNYCPFFKRYWYRMDGFSAWKYWLLWNWFPHTVHRGDCNSENEQCFYSHVWLQFLYCTNINLQLHRSHYQGARQLCQSSCLVSHALWFWRISPITGKVKWLSCPMPNQTAGYDKHQQLKITIGSFCNILQPSWVKILDLSPQSGKTQRAGLSQMPLT